MVHSDLDSYPVPNPAVVGRVLPGEGGSATEAVLVLPFSGQVKVLNEVAARIWQLADGRRSVRGIAAQISAEYQVTLEQAEVDTLAFIADLAKRGVLTLAVRPAQEP